MQLLISDEQDEAPVGEDLYSLIAEALEAVLATEPGGSAGFQPADGGEPEVSMLFVDDARMAALNRQYRGLDATTDVLSFPMLDEAGGSEAGGSEAGQAGAGAQGCGLPPSAMPELLLGDIVISVPRALDQAAGYGASLQREMVFLAVHGMLHLLGYDDETEQGAARMMERSVLVMDRLGLGAGRRV